MDNIHQEFHCPLCCKRTFSSKATLIEHLSNYKSNFRCPICEIKVSSITMLLKHLRTSDCDSHIKQEDLNKKKILEQCLTLPKHENQSLITAKAETLENKFIEKVNYNSNTSAIDHDLNDLSEHTYVNSEDSKVYVDLLHKTSSSHNTHFLEESDHNKYTVLHLDGTIGSSIVTKQNSDGTISITTLKEGEDNLNLESEPVISVKDQESDGKEEIFSCNTCGVTFTSVIEHIQNYHKDQDVVVEMNEGQIVEETETHTLDTVKENSIDQQKQPIEIISVKPDNTQDAVSRRVITDTGDIVETISSSVAGNNTMNETLSKNIPLSSLEMEVVDQKGRVFTRRYVQIDKFNDTSVNTVGNEAKTPFHQVVIKEVVTTENGERMKVYNCIACHIYVSELQEFKLHPCKSLKYKCSFCPVGYENAKSLCAHMKVHKVLKQQPIKVLKTAPSSESPSESPFKCDICNTEFQTQKSLKLHKRMHDPVKSRPIEPPVEDNIDPKDANVDKYLCGQCYKWIPVGYRTVHLNYHKHPENLNCDICNKKFTSTSYLAMHMNVHNVKNPPMKQQDETLPYACLYCERKFARPHEKVKHERIHTGEKPHTCAICGKSFRVSYCLTLHMRTHTGARPYHCKHCGKRFKAHSVYNHHLMTHSDVRAYKCPYCPKAFKTSVQLAGHKNSHTKPFSCTQCNRPFASLYAVRVHTETHRGQNNLKFSCTKCGASYARSFALKDHMKQAHGDEEPAKTETLETEEWTTEFVMG